MPEEAFYIEAHRNLLNEGSPLDIQKFVPDLTETKFVETFKAEPKPVAMPTAATETSAQAP